MCRQTRLKTNLLTPFVCRTQKSAGQQPLLLQQQRIISSSLPLTYQQAFLELGRINYLLNNIEYQSKGKDTVLKMLRMIYA